MACITVFAPTMTMATTQFERVISHEAADRRTSGQTFELSRERSLRMNWVVVTGENGSRLLRAQWLPADES
jgi:hypothetical protein